VAVLLAGALLCLALQPPRQPQPHPASRSATQPGRAATQPGQAAGAGAGTADRSAPDQTGAERDPQAATDLSPM